MYTTVCVCVCVCEGGWGEERTPALNDLAMWLRCLRAPDMLVNCSPTLNSREAAPTLGTPFGLPLHTGRGLFFSSRDTRG